MMTVLSVQARPRLRQRWKRNWATYKTVYLMLVPILAYYLLFHYVPMLGSVIAFQNFKPALGITGSKWVGLRHFRSFFESPYAWRVIRNTLTINGLQILFSFPAPIVFALLLNEVRCKGYKRAVQTVSYMPHFISLVVICGIVRVFTSSTGLITTI